MHHVVLTGSGTSHDVIESRNRKPWGHVTCSNSDATELAQSIFILLGKLRETDQRYAHDAHLLHLQ